MKNTQTRFLEAVEQAAFKRGAEARFDQTAASNVGVLTISFEDSFAALIRWKCDFQGEYFTLLLEQPSPGDLPCYYPADVQERYAKSGNDTWYVNQPEITDQVLKALANIVSAANTKRLDEELADASQPR